MKKLTKKNITTVLISIQDNGNLEANSIATQAVIDFGLQHEHQKQTGNPKECYKDFAKWVTKLKQHTFAKERR